MTEGCSLRANENNARISFSPSPYPSGSSEETWERILKIMKRDIDSDSDNNIDNGSDVDIDIITITSADTNKT